MEIKTQTNMKVFFDNDYTYDVKTGYLSKSSFQKESYYSELTSNKNYSYSTNVPLLQISLTDKCNMACKYCSFRSREGANNKPVEMPISVAEQAMEFFKQQYKDYEGQARVDFGLAGEPLLMRKKHPHLINKARELLEDTKLKNVWVGTVTTNGTLALREDVADNISPPMDISCDGPEHVHDASRTYVNGKGTYKDVEKIAKKILVKYPSIGVSCVLTAKHTDFVEIFLHLRENMGFKSIYMKPVNLDRDTSWGLNEHTLESFKIGYTNLINFFINQSPEKLLDYLSSLAGDDYFMRFFNRVKDRSYQVYRCGAGKSGAYVDTDGKLYACAHFIGKQGWDIGSIYEGFKEEIVKQFIEMDVDSKEPCKSCWARYLCGGGCYYQAALVNKDISKPDEVKCELIIHLCKEAIRLHIFLSENHPNVISALPSPYYLPNSSLKMSAEHIYKPTAQFKLNDLPYKPIDLLNINKIENKLLLGNEKASVYIKQNQSCLEIDLKWNDSFPLEEIKIFIINPLKNEFSYNDLSSGSTDLIGDNLIIKDGKLFKIIAAEKTKVKQLPYIDPLYEEVEGCTIISNHDEIKICIPLECVWGENIPEEYGFNLLLNLKNNGLLRLIRYEPFAMIKIQDNGYFCLINGEFNSTSDTNLVCNDDKIKDYLPLGRWHGRMANVC